MTIKVLPPSIANMIAAGEVVERPASVVKELAENSIDAGAKTVTIEIKQGGMSYIRVTDDGCGIPHDQVETAFVRHATSKIATASDLNSIYTLGFRGEALASIAAVARVDAFTKISTAELGICLSIEGGQVISKEDAGCSNGTTIVVRDLFFNTPARMKFLKSDKVETGYVTDMVNKLVLGHPNVKIKLIVNGKVTVDSQGDSKLESAIYSVYGKSYLPHLVPVSYDQDGLSVTGFVGTGEISRKDRRGQIFFINSRYITSKIISAALSEAFQSFLMTGKYPVAVLNINVSGAFVDVNVHPTKIEVRFSDEKKVYHSIYWAVKNALSGEKHIPAVSLTKEAAQSKVRQEKIKLQNSATQLDINLLKDSIFETKPQSDFAKDVGKPRGEDEDKSFSASKMSETPSLNDSLLKGNDSKKEQDLPDKSPSKDISSFENEEKNEKDISRHIMESSFFSKSDLSLLSSGEGRAKKDYQNEKVKEAEKYASQRGNADTDDSLQDAIPDASFTQNDLKQNTDKVSCTPKDLSNEDKNSKECQPLPKAGVDFLLIGQVFATYILVQKGKEMLIIDQHAAQERLFFEELCADYESKDIYSQLLLVPAAVDLDPISFSLVWENEEFLKELGFECETFGESTVLLRSVPSIISDSDIEETFREILSLVSRGCQSITKAILEEILHTMACKRAIKGNRVLGKEEMESLCQKVLSMDYINTCPHGRPICISMSQYEMEKQFKRV